MEIICGKPINSSILKGKYNKRQTCESLKRFCQSFSKGTRTCPVCGGTKSKMLAEIYDFIYVECSDCTLVYISNPPTNSEIQNLYNTPFYSGLENDLYGDPEVSDYRVTNIAIPKVVFVEERLDRKGAWLDIGCGTGEILAAAQPRGWRVAGIETNVQTAEIGRARFGVPISTEFITETESSRLVGDFDVISLFGVLEHFYDPDAVVKILGDHMKAGAALVIEVPHYPSISCFSQMAFPGLVDRMMAPPMHLMIFSLEALTKLLQRYGLTIKHVWFYGQDFYEWVTTLMEAHPEALDKTIFERFLTLSGDCQKVIDQNHLSDEMLVIARKDE